MKKEFITNMYDPRLSDAIDYIVKNDDEDKKKLLFNMMQEKLVHLMIDIPQPTDVYTSEQLSEMNIVGIYTKDTTPKHVISFFVAETTTKTISYEPEHVLNDDEQLAERISKVEQDIDF